MHAQFQSTSIAVPERRQRLSLRDALEVLRIRLSHREMLAAPAASGDARPPHGRADSLDE
jgi:hypothetical protein